jgi:hypothetical protein
MPKAAADVRRYIEGLRFQALEDLPLDVIGRTVKATPMKEYVAADRAVHSKEGAAKRKAAKKVGTAKKRG